MGRLCFALFCVLFFLPDITGANVVPPPEGEFAVVCRCWPFDAQPGEVILTRSEFIVADDGRTYLKRSSDYPGINAMQEVVEIFDEEPPAARRVEELHRQAVAHNQPRPAGPPRASCRGTLFFVHDLTVVEVTEEVRRQEISVDDRRVHFSNDTEPLGYHLFELTGDPELPLPDNHEGYYDFCQVQRMGRVRTVPTPTPAPTEDPESAPANPEPSDSPEPAPAPAPAPPEPEDSPEPEPVPSDEPAPAPVPG